MKTSLKLTTTVLLACAVVAFFGMSQAGTTNASGELDPKLYQALFKQKEAFSAEHGISLGDALAMASRMNIELPMYPKGSIGIINKGICADTGSKTNLILIKDAWLAFPTTNATAELLVVSQDRVLGAITLEQKQPNDIVLVLYTPSAIRFFDWSNFAGGTYPRRE